MMARLVGIILGVILATSGYVIAGLGALGDWAQNLDLGPFEPHRPFVGWAAAITGALLLVAALTPRPKPKPRQSKATAVLDLAPAASPILGPDAAPAPEPALEPAPPKQIARTVEPVAPPMRLTSATPAVLPAGLDDPVAEPMRLSDPTPVPPPVEIPPPEASVEAIMPPLIAEPPPAEPVIIPAVAAPTPETPPEPPPAAAPAPTETFDDLRARLIAQSRAEAWPEAAQTLNRLLRVAGDNREKALARRDLGDFARGQGRLDDAAEAYDDAVSYAREARAAKPASEGDFAADDLLAGALSGVGDVAEMEGRLNDALSAFEEALALRRSHGGREAADPNARRALSVSLERLADLREDRGHRMRALDLYRESYDVAARLAAADPARFGADLASTRARLAELEAKVAG